MLSEKEVTLKLNSKSPTEGYQAATKLGMVTARQNHEGRARALSRPVGPSHMAGSTRTGGGQEQKGLTRPSSRAAGGLSPTTADTLKGCCGSLEGESWEKTERPEAR